MPLLKTAKNQTTGLLELDDVILTVKIKKYQQDNNVKPTTIKKCIFAILMSHFPNQAA